MDQLPILTDKIRVLEHGVAVPPTERQGAIGVLDSKGRFLEESREYVPFFSPVAAPDQTVLNQEIEYQPGTYLYAGWLHQHFGHAILESVARLWPLAESAAKIDGIAFLSRGPKTIWRARRANAEIIKFFGRGLPDRPVTVPTRFERLIVADAATGIGERMKSTSAFRHYLSDLAKAVPRDSRHDRIYLSRRKLPNNKGRVLGEDHLVNALAKNGYAEIHLQDHSLEQQIAIVRSARWIVSPDGSPMHLVSYFANPQANVAMLVRRNPLEPEQMALQFATLQQRKLLFLNHLGQVWIDAGSRKANNTVLGEVDFERVGQDLLAAGFVNDTSGFSNLTASHITSIQESLGRSRMKTIPIDAYGLIED